MSEWYDIKKEDIRLDVLDKNNKDEVNINFGFNDCGERYITIKTKELLEFLKENRLIK